MTHFINPSVSLPADASEVALIDAAKCAAIGDMSVSWWHAEVAAGRAPPPVIRRPRCSRWRARDVATFWRSLVERYAAEPDTAEAVKKQAKKASDAAKAKRASDAARAARAAA